MPPVYKGASEEDFQAWEALIDRGVKPYVAAQEVGTTLSRLSRGDQVRKEAGMALAKERQTARIEKKMTELTDQADPPQALMLAEAKAYHPDYRDRVEVTGADGGPLEVRQAEIATAIDRFTAAVVQLAARGGEGDAARELGRGDEGHPGLRVAPLDRETEPATSSG